MNIKNLLKILSFFMLFLLLGCMGNPPEPYHKKLLTNINNISNEEKEELLDNLIDRYILWGSMKYKLKFYSKYNGCIYLKDYWDNFKYQNHFKNCFILKNNSIVRIDKSVCSDDYGQTFNHENCAYIGGVSDKYSNFINEIQNRLMKDFERELKAYSLFKKSCMKLRQERKKILKQVKVKIVDKTKIVPKDILNKIHIDVYEYDPYFRCINLYNKLFYSNKLVNIALENHFDKFLKIIQHPELYASHFQICGDISIDPKVTYQDGKMPIGRYILWFNHTSICKGFNDPHVNNLIFYITKVSYDFVPNQFSLKDKYIFAKVFNKYNKFYNYHELNKITIKNNTDQFIKIISISLYYGNDVKKVLKVKKDILISPEATKDFKVDDELIYFPHNHYVEINNKNQKVKYGVSIAYKIINENILRTLFKIKKYSIYDFK